MSAAPNDITRPGRQKLSSATVYQWVFACTCVYFCVYVCVCIVFIFMCACICVCAYVGLFRIVSAFHHFNPQFLISPALHFNDILVFHHLACPLRFHAMRIPVKHFSFSVCCWYACPRHNMRFSSEKKFSLYKCLYCVVYKNAVFLSLVFRHPYVNILTTPVLVS